MMKMTVMVQLSDTAIEYTIKAQLITCQMVEELTEKVQLDMHLPNVPSESNVTIPSDISCRWIVAQ